MPKSVCARELDCPKLAPVTFIADDAYPVAGLSCTFSRKGEYAPVIDGPRLNSSGRRCRGNTCQREPLSSLTRRRASATRFAYARRPRQSAQCLGEAMEGTFAISLVGRDSTTEPKWANLSKRAVPVGQQSERNLHRGLRSLLHPLWAWWLSTCWRNGGRLAATVLSFCLKTKIEPSGWVPSFMPSIPRAMCLCSRD